MLQSHFKTGKRSDIFEEKRMTEREHKLIFKTKYQSFFSITKEKQQDKNAIIN